MRCTSKDVLSLKFKGEQFYRDPEIVFGPLRQAGSVVRVRLPIIGKVWFTTDYAATSAMLKDNGRFSMRKPSNRRWFGGRANDVSGVQWWMPRSIHLLANNMLTHDDPSHRRLRRLVDQAFQRRAVLELETSIERTAEGLLNTAEQTGDTDKLDLVPCFASALPLEVICNLLGLLEPHRTEFLSQARRISDVNGIFSFLRALFAIKRIIRLLSQVVDEEKQRQTSGKLTDSLIGYLVAAEADGDKLNKDELISMIFLLLLAGHETTTHLISGSVWSLLKAPDQWDWLQKKPDGLPLAVDELLRFVSPVQFSKPRTVRQSGQFFGAAIEEGDLIMAGLAGANRDPKQFDQPNILDLQRRPNPHIEFGTGIHFCLGSQLARLELKVALQVLMRRYPNMKLIEEGTVWRERTGLRGLKHLMLHTQ